jgi:hypothetical protein
MLGVERWALGVCFFSLLHRMKRKKIVVMGFMGSCPIAGVIWQHLHYIVGLQRLGHDVYYVEDSARLPYNPETFEVGDEFDYAAQLLDRLAREFEFKNRWSFCARYLPDNPTAGMPLKKVRQLYREADAILNICGTQEFNDDLLTSDRILYIESDPGVEQIKIDQGARETIAYLRRHHALFTFGENVGSKGFPVPAHRFKWLPTRQPVVTDLWKTRRSPPQPAVLTSIANWSTSGLKDITWRGRRYLWSKSPEFLRFIAAPKKAGETFELATHIKDQKIKGKLSGMVALDVTTAIECRLLALPRLHPGTRKASLPSRADQYIRSTPAGSAIAALVTPAGRPVITQETGLVKNYGGEKGLLAFQSLEKSSRP